VFCVLWSLIFEYIFLVLAIHHHHMKLKRMITQPSESSLWWLLDEDTLLDVKDTVSSVFSFSTPVCLILVLVVCVFLIGWILFHPKSRYYCDDEEHPKND
jgi:hypothetical protein